MARVRAIRKCFFNGIHRDPDKDQHREFEVPTKEQFSENAMELLEGESFDPPKPKKKAKAKKTEDKVEASE